MVLNRPKIGSPTLFRRLLTFLFLRHLSLTFFLLFSILPPLFSVSPVFSAQVTLQWDPNNDPNTAGYRVYYGTQSKNYQFVVDAGNATTVTISNLNAGQTYFFAATAYDLSNNESAFSNEVSTGSGTANGLVAYWTMDDGGGTTASDSSGLGNNGVVSGGATWTTGEVGGALSFDGISGAMTVPNVGGLAAGNTSHTVAAWVNVTSLPPNRAWILLLGNEGTGAHHWLINNWGGTQLGVWNGAQVWPTLAVGQWTHIAVTFDGATLAGYVDGVLVGSIAATFDLEGIPLTLGEQHVGKNNFDGIMDDVRIYNRALTPAEIAALAAGGNQS